MGEVRGKIDVLNSEEYSTTAVLLQEMSGALIKEEARIGGGRHQKTMVIS